MEESRSWWLVTIASAGLEGPGGEVVAVGLGQKLVADFRRSVLRVHGLLLTLFFVVILCFNLDTLELHHSSMSGF